MTIFMMFSRPILLEHLTTGLHFYQLSFFAKFPLTASNGGIYRFLTQTHYCAYYCLFHGFVIFLYMSHPWIHIIFHTIEFNEICKNQNLNMKYHLKLRY